MTRQFKFFAGPIGAGIFALPYVFMKTGSGAGIAYLVAFGGIMALFSLMYADALLRTAGRHNFVTMARLYLGASGGLFVGLLTALTMIAVLCAYLVLAAEFIPFAAIPLWVAGSSALFVSLARIADFEFISGLAIAALITFIACIALFDGFSPMLAPQSASLWLPVAPLIFAFGGRSSVSQLVRYVPRAHVARAILFTFGSIAVIYAVFAVSAVSLLGGAVTPDLISGLRGVLSAPLFGAVVFLGLAALLHAYVLVAYDLHMIATVDFGAPSARARALVLVAPLALYAALPHDFFVLIGIVGGLFAVLENIFIGLIWCKVRAEAGGRPIGILNRAPYWVPCAAIAIFAVIFVHEFAVRVF
jgi:amino acid permease